MAYVARPSDFRGAVPFREKNSLSAPRRRFWRRLIERLLEGQQREAQRAIEQYVARRGKLTDSIEREIAERLMRSRF